MDIARRLIGPTEELLQGFRAVVTLDEPGALEAARTDPIGFLHDQPANVAIGEFQRSGNDLLMDLKVELDQSDVRGQYLLAGSTRFLSTRPLSETLTGRIGLTELLPVSMGERLGLVPVVSAHRDSSSSEHRTGRRDQTPRTHRPTPRSGCSPIGR